ncbi:MAG: hypothetical protein M1828_004056 [Chrysothrix sp. TS-e1954]|nr:MAG: hypothetical protein M1828_004056 [Chrysothrix sp. TS-e1954]
MVSLTDEIKTSYLPPLDQCFDGRNRLLSWRSACEALSEPTLQDESQGLRTFLQDEEVVQILSKSFDAIEGPNPRAKTDFDTRTASINITPSGNGSYDINEIKNDAAWLSEHAKVDQLTALRVVILEWQERSRTRILRGFTEEEVISLQRTLGSRLPTTFSAYASQKNENGEVRFNSTEQRQARIFSTWLVEYGGLVRTAAVLDMLCFLDLPKPPPGRSYGPNEASDLRNPSWIRDAGDRVSNARNARAVSSMKKDATNQVLEAIRRHLESFELGCNSIDELVEGAQLNEDYRTCQLDCIVYLLQLFSARISALPRFPPTSIVREWFQLLEAYRFFQYIQLPSPGLQGIINTSVQPLVCITSLQILKLPLTLERISNAEDHQSLAVLDVACQTQINKTLIAAAESDCMLAGPAMLAWLIILQRLRGEVELTRRASFSSDDSGSPSLTRQASQSGSAVYAEALDCLASTDLREDPIEFFAKAAGDQLQTLQTISALSLIVCRIARTISNEHLEMHFRVALMELTRQASVLLTYGPEILEAVLSILTSMPSDSKINLNSHPDVFLADVFLHDAELLAPNLLGQARDRYPYETVPFLKLCQALSSSITSRHDDMPLITQTLMAVPKLTQQLPQGFSNWELVGEDESASCFKLTRALPLFVDRRRAYTGTRDEASTRKAMVEYGQPSGKSYELAHGTTGFVVSDSKPHIIMWSHQHSAFSYLGLALSSALVNSTIVEPSAKSKMEKNLQADIVILLTRQLRAACRAKGIMRSTSEKSTMARQILEEASDRLERDQDIVTVIETILEDELSHSAGRRWEDGALSLELLVACIDFLRALLLVMPEKTWSIISRSRLLNTEGRGHLRDVVASLEVPRKKFDFLNGCLCLFGDLVDDVIERGVSRLSSSTIAVQRFRDSPRTMSNVLQRTMSKTLLTFTRTAVDALQSLGDWTVDDPEERWRLNSLIVNVFNQTLLAIYGQDDVKSADIKLTGALVASSEYILGIFSTKDMNNIALAPLLRICASSLEAASLSRNSTQQVSDTLALFNTLLRIKHLSLEEHSTIYRQLLLSVPLLVRLHVRRPEFQRQINLIFINVVNGLDRSDTSTSSLLGDLNADVARDFLKLLRSLTGGLRISNADDTFWSLFEAIVSTQQKWIATFLLSGETPSRCLKHDKGKDTAQVRSSSILQDALDSLSSISNLNEVGTYGMLGFVSAAQNYWPWVSQTLRRHPKFLENAMSLMENLDLKPRENSSTFSVLRAKEIRTASLLLDVFAIYLHNMAQLGDVSLIKSLVPRLTLLSQHGMLDPSYNSSLHLSLRRNFEAKFQGCTLNSFRRVLDPSEAHDEEFYNISFASQVLSYSSAWESERGGGYKKEMEMANRNLYLVEAQIRALTSWKLLATELSKHMSVENGLQKSLSYVALEAMDANRNSLIPEVISQDLSVSRIELVFTLLQRLVTAKSQQPVMKSMLTSFWQVILHTGQDFETAFTSPGKDHFRLLLRTLLLCLQPGTYTDFAGSPMTNGSSDKSSKHLPESMSHILIEIANEIVAKGFRTLATLLHEEPASVETSDLSLVTSILQTILHYQGVELLHQQLALTLYESNVHRNALSLFSWSDRLTADGDDPVLGELSISFLLELSSIPALADFMASEGILSDLSTASLTDSFRQDAGIGAFDQPTRLYNIWSRGILPLTLNILLAAGEAYVGEATAFLNGFSTQIERASSALDAKGIPSSKDPTAGCITLSAACEAHIISLLSHAIAQFRTSPGAAALGEIPDLKWDQAAVKDDLESWVQGTRAALRERIVPTTEREVAMKKAKPSLKRPCGCESLLEQMVVVELEGALKVLGS